MVKTVSNRQIAEASPEQMNPVGSALYIGTDMYRNIESALLISNIENALLIADLEWVAARLPKQDNISAGRLLRAYDAKGDLSPKQAALAQSILRRAQEAGVN